MLLLIAPLALFAPASRERFYFIFCRRQKQLATPKLLNLFNSSTFFSRSREKKKSKNRAGLDGGGGGILLGKCFRGGDEIIRLHACRSRFCGGDFCD